MIFCHRIFPVSLENPLFDGRNLFKRKSSVSGCDNRQTSPPVYNATRIVDGIRSRFGISARPFAYISQKIKTISKSGFFFFLEIITSYVVKFFTPENTGVDIEIFTCHIKPLFLFLCLLHFFDGFPSRNRSRGRAITYNSINDIRPRRCWKSIVPGYVRRFFFF